MLKKHKTNSTVWLGFDIMKYPPIAPMETTAFSKLCALAGAKQAVHYRACNIFVIVTAGEASSQFCFFKS